MYEKVSWDDFRNKLVWKQGEHMALIAPTGAGKTTLMRYLMPYRKFNIMFGTKPDDKTYRDIIAKNGYRRIESIKEIKPWDEKLLLWPRHTDNIRDTIVKQRIAFEEAMNMIVRQKAWTVWIDEAKYMSQMLKLDTEITFMMEQLRSIDATIISGAQRPAWLSRSVIANSTHIAMWKTVDSEDAKRLGDIGGIDRKEVMETAKTLSKHEFLYIKTRGTEVQIVRTQVDRK